VEKIYPREYAENFIKLLNPIAPFMTEEIWEKLGHNTTIAYEAWPLYDEEKAQNKEIVIGVQVNGKIRSEITVSYDEEKEVVLEKALQEEKVKKYLEGKEILKTIVVPNKIVNIVVK